MTACTPSEDPITPSGNYSVLRMEFPQGNNSWDEDIKEILQKAQKGGVCYPQDLLKIVQILKNVQEVQAYLDQEIEQSHLLEILSLLLKFSNQKHLRSKVSFLSGL